ncbi:MAG: response regulator transcription factor [Pseudogulbenkiania sp.]|nr:response regulator transcription factor [Pseudogulbenkiania sp.]
MRVFGSEPWAAPMPTSASRPSRLFVVEDSDVVRALWRTVVANIPGLSLAGEFNCASTAIAAIRRAPPDVVLLDIHLSEGDGMEVLRVIAAEYPMTKVIVVSNCADQTHRRYATEYPMTEVIVVSNCTDLTHRRYCTKAGAYAFYDKGHGLAATRCMRCMLECLAGQIDNKPTLMRAIRKWSQTAHGTHH